MGVSLSETKLKQSTNDLPKISAKYKKWKFIRAIQVKIFTFFFFIGFSVLFFISPLESGTWYPSESKRNPVDACLPAFSKYSPF